MSAPLCIEGELTVYAVHALKERLLAALDESARLQLDLSGVAEVDGAGIQLLLATQREARQRDGALSLIGVPPQLRDALELANLHGEFTSTTAPELEPAA